MTTDVHIAAKALEELRVRGHRKGDYIGPDGTVCLAGAFLAARGGWLSWHSPAGTLDAELAATGRRLNRIIIHLFSDRVPPGFYPSPWALVTDFNDDQRTTREDVELVLKHLIEQETDDRPGD